MNRIRLTLAVCAALTLGSTAAAQVPGPSCAAPARPAELKTQEQINGWARLVEAYQKCLMDYSAEQKRISDQHAKAANDAVQRWNAFVRETNAATASN